MSAASPETRENVEDTKGSWRGQEGEEAARVKVERKLPNAQWSQARETGALLGMMQVGKFRRAAYLVETQ
jgi:hypothetical protein